MAHDGVAVPRRCYVPHRPIVDSVVDRAVPPGNAAGRILRPVRSEDRVEHMLVAGDQGA